MQAHGTCIETDKPKPDTIPTGRKPKDLRIDYIFSIPVANTRFGMRTG
jgi:hypothetical protein